MAPDPGTRDVDYTLALRVVGRHLDAEPAYHVSILEIDDGFTVRYQPTQHRSDGRTVHFPKARLHDLFVFQSAGRGVPRRSQRHEGMWLKFREGHQEFLRALGTLLDEEKASSLSLDELADEVRVSYMRSDPNNPVQSEKRVLVLRERDIEVLVRDARARRAIPTDAAG